MSKQRTWIKGKPYRIIRSPDPIVDADGVRCNIVRDDIDRVLWTDPSLDGEKLDMAIIVAVINASAPTASLR